MPLTDDLELLYDFFLFVWKVDLVDFLSHVVGPVVAVSSVLGHLNNLLLVNELVSQLDGQVEVKVKYACLTHVFYLSAHLTYFGLLVARLGAGLPAEYSERPRAYFTLATEFRLGHANVRVVAEASLTQYWEVRLLPSLFARAGAYAHASLS